VNLAIICPDEQEQVFHFFHILNYQAEKNNNTKARLAGLR
jgi:hypothetical protein